MRIKIPRFIVRAWDTFGDWANVPVFLYKGNDPNLSPYTQAKIEIRRVDVLIAIVGIVCVSWYTYTLGWRGAILGAALYVLMIMIGLWMFRG